MTAPLILKRGGAGKGDGVKKGPIVWTPWRPAGNADRQRSAGQCDQSHEDFKVIQDRFNRLQVAVREADVDDRSSLF